MYQERQGCQTKLTTTDLMQCEKRDATRETRRHVALHLADGHAPSRATDHRGCEHKRLMEKRPDVCWFEKARSQGEFREAQARKSPGTFNDRAKSTSRQGLLQDGDLASIRCNATQCIKSLKGQYLNMMDHALALSLSL